MTTQIQSRNSTSRSKRCLLRRFLRSTIATSLIAGLVSSATAQTNLVLPTFPIESAALPIATDLSNPFTGSRPEACNSSPLQKVTALLGLRKQERASDQVPFDAGLILPTFPSTLLKPNSVSAAADFQVAAPNSHAPTISKSSSTKSDNGSPQFVILASADESSIQLTRDPSEDDLTQITIPRIDSTEIESTESASIESESPAESLIDFGPSAPSVMPSSEHKQRLPELVKFQPTMQLHIGGNASQRSEVAEDEPLQQPVPDAPSITLLRSTAVNNEDTTANFSLSDANADTSASFSLSDPNDEALAPKVAASVYSNALLDLAVPTLPSKPMNIRIEGEPIFMHASDRSSVADDSQFATAPLASAPLASAPLVTASLASASLVTASKASAPLATAQVANARISGALPSPEISSRSPAPQSLTVKPAAPTQTLGESVEVALQESTNVETPRAMSGFSIEHPELCQVLKNGERSISLVGLMSGQTRVALFTTDSNGERKIEIREVVIAATEARPSEMSSIVREIKRNVRNLYPNSQIEIIAEDEGLTVQGYAGSEAEAKKIIRLVRGTSLQPVVDRIVTYK